MNSKPTMTMNGRDYVLIEKPPADVATAARNGLFDDYPAIMHPSDVAEAFGISTQRVNDLCRQGIMPSVQISARRRVISKKALSEWFEAGGFNA